MKQIEAEDNHCLEKNEKGSFSKNTLPTGVRNYWETLSEVLRDHVGPGG
jgi:hypothetical protein